MRAARLHANRDIRVDDVPIPECPRGHVTIAPRFNGICGSDLHLFYDEPLTTALKTPHPITGEILPITLGHEFSGVITEIGRDIETLKAGDRVVVQPIIHDGTCSACQRGAINCCRNIGFQGVHGRGGGLSDAVVTPEASVFKLPENVTNDVGALIEPLSVGWHAVRNAGRCSDSTVALVHGSGPIGSAVILALKAQGAGHIIVSEISETRWGLAKQFGADLIINPLETDLIQAVNKFTGDEGVDLVFDCAGVPTTLTTGITSLKPLGVFTNLAIWSEPAPLNSHEMLLKEITYRGSLAYTPQDFAEVIAAVGDKRLIPDAMITKKIALKDLVKEGIETLRYQADQHCKVLVDLNL